MTELVEQGGDLVVGEQCGLAGGRFGHVEIVADHGCVGVEQRGLGDQSVHPGPTALGVAGVEIADEQPHRGAALGGDLEDPCFGVPADQVGPSGEGEAVQPVGRVEDTVGEHIFEFKVRAHGCGIDVIPGPAHLLGVERPVPGSQLEPAALRVDHGLQVGLLHPRIAGRGRREAAEHIPDGSGSFGGFVGCHVRGMAIEPEQPGALGTQVGDLDHEWAVVVASVGRIRADAAGSARREQPFPYAPVGEARQIRVRGGEHEADQVFAVELAFPGGLGRGRDLTVGEPGELGDVINDERELIGIGEQILFEMCAEGR